MDQVLPKKKKMCLQMFLENGYGLSSSHSTSMGQTRIRSEKEI